MELSEETIEAIVIELESVKKYERGCCGEIVLDGFAGVKYKDAATYLVGQGQRDGRLGAIGNVSLARCEEKTATRAICALLRKAIGLCPTYARAYNLAGIAISKPSIEFEMPDGRLLRQHELFELTIRHDPTHANAYGNLATEMVKFQMTTVNLDFLPGDGKKEFTKAELHVRNIELDPGCAAAYINLAICLVPGETIVVPLLGPRVWTKTDLLKTGVQLDPQYENGLRNLAIIAGETGPVTMDNGRVMDEMALMEEALLCAANTDRAKSIRDWIVCRVAGTHAWKRRTHEAMWGMRTQLLFAALLLGFQRLEAHEVIPPAHHSMLEEMLEGWTWADTTANIVNQ